jgi:hypothetical protein
MFSPKPHPGLAGDPTFGPTLRREIPLVEIDGGKATGESDDEFGQIEIGSEVGSGAEKKSRVLTTPKQKAMLAALVNRVSRERSRSRRVIC